MLATVLYLTNTSAVRNRLLNLRAIQARQEREARSGGSPLDWAAAVESARQALVKELTSEGHASGER